MEFLKRKLSLSKGAKDSVFVGSNFLEKALRGSILVIGNEPTNNLYHASLKGGDFAARLMLTTDERCQHFWGKGDLRKAARLLEVWATSVMVVLLHDDDNQDSVVSDTASGFGTIFNTDPQLLRTEISYFGEAMKIELARQGEKGARTFTKDILYLRTLKALGDPGVPDFDEFPVPWGTLREVMAAKPDLRLDLTILTNIANGWYALEALGSGLETAHRVREELAKSS